MDKKALVFLILMVLCADVSLSPHLLKEVDATSGFPVHNISTGLNYATIQSAINAIQTVDGNSIRVDAGTYNETLTVSKGVLLMGIGPSTTINGLVTLSSSGAEIANFTLNGRVEVAAYSCTISNNIIINTDSYGVGVKSTHTNNGIIQYNKIEDFSGPGIYIVNCNGWTILGNDIDNNRAGIDLDHSLNCIITENSIHKDWLSPLYSPPLYLEQSSHNTIYHNNFFDNQASDNEKQATIAGYSGTTYPNYWDNGKEGNYWDDYNGTDRGDGIGDVPYVISGDNQDNFPLMHMYNIPEFPSFIVLTIFMLATLLAVTVYRKKHAKISEGL